jgi:hypothetical protein
MKTFLAAMFCLYNSFATAEEPLRKVLGEGYEIMFPTSWKEQTTLSPSGQPIRFFYKSGSREQGTGCTIEVARIEKENMPMLSRLSSKQKREFLMAEWDIEDWFALFPNLTSTTDFKVANNFKTSIGGNMPASVLEYSYRLPNGYHYRTRLLFTISTNMQYVLSCFGFGRSVSSSRDEFQRSASTFQRIYYSLLLKEN